ncbi:MAG: tRNA lysidine(34) synthetase TilS [Coxiellaceae bacterium]|nr:tRNA lysidine(34) synthetase TilS [Coxiellaceae bacterium]
MPTDFQTIMHRYSGASRWLVAFSGGLDSTVLLHRLRHLKQYLPNKPELVAVHIDHGLHTDADQWQQQCQDLCKQWGVEFVTHTVSEACDAKDSMEAWARQQRYRIFQQMAQDDDVFITAHHQSDQVETLLLQSLRGAGPYGMAGMPWVKALGNAKLLRPLLNETRQDLLQYALKHKLKWVNDPSNANTLIDRNYVRHQVVPVLFRRWPEMNKTMARSARLLADSLELLDDLAAIDLPHVLSDWPNCLSIAGLQTLSQVRQQHVIRYWLRQRELPLPSEDQMQQLFDAVIAAAEDAQPLLTWTYQGVSVEARRYRDFLYIAPAVNHQLLQSQNEWDTKKPLLITQDIDVSYMDFFGDNVAYVDQSLQVKWNQSGASIKKFFQSKNIPTWLRGLMPIFYNDDQQIKDISYTVLVKKLLNP